MKSLKRFTIVGIGELLWDLFPEGKQLGGAPANFAYMTSLLGDEGLVASRVGNDALGRSAARRLAADRTEEFVSSTGSDAPNRNREGGSGRRRAADV